MTENFKIKAATLDEQNEVGHFREKFHIPKAKNSHDETLIEDDRECIYFNGNSLGCMVSTEILY